MATATDFKSDELLAQFFEPAATTSEEARLAELYHFANFGRLAAGLFHDLATPLNIVLLNLEELQEKCTTLSGSEILELKTSVDRAFNGTERMMRFLALAREHLQQKSVLSMFSVQNEISASINTITQAKKGGKISFEFTGEDWQIFGNSTQFFQVILNLLSNAVDAYPPQTHHKKIRILTQVHEHERSVTIQDWGEGIPLENHSHIFEPFFTSKKITKGSGIGLFISRSVIEKYFHGQLDFISQPGQGTIFTIHLPRKPAPLVLGET